MTYFKVGDKVKWDLASNSFVFTVCGEYCDESSSLIWIKYQEGARFLVEKKELKLVEFKESSDLDDEYSYYKYSYKGIKLDPYRILSVYGITCPAQQHAIKKLLRAGNSVKDTKQDIQEVIDTLQRKLEMLKEDEENSTNKEYGDSGQ